MSQDLSHLISIARLRRIFIVTSVRLSPETSRRQTIPHNPPSSSIAYEERSMFLTKHRVRQKWITILFLILHSTTQTTNIKWTWSALCMSKVLQKTSVTRISLPLMLIYGFKITQLGFDCCQATTLIDLYTWTFTKGQSRQPSVVSRLEISMSRLFLCFPYVMRPMKYESS